MKVLIVSPCGLPVPAVKGGAVATMIENIINENERSNLMDLVVISSYDKNAETRSKDYTKASFRFIKESKLVRIIDQFIEKVLLLLKKNSDTPRRFIWKTHVISTIEKDLINNEYDKVVFENAGFLLRVLKNKNVLEKYKGRLYYHLHNDVPSSVKPKELKQCKLLIISKYLQDRIDKLCGCDMSSSITVLKNGFCTEKFAEELEKYEERYLKEKLGIDPRKKIVLFAGRINANKGIQYLLDAFLECKNNDLILLVVGSHNFGSSQHSDFERNLYEKFSKLAGQIVFTGFIPYEEMWKYYALADIGVFPSMWNEPAGLTMLEASAAGLPVITTISGGIPEYLPSDLVTFVDRDNIVNNLVVSIEKVFDNYEIWKDKAKKCSDYVKNNYSLEVYYNNFCKALDIIAAK